MHYLFTRHIKLIKKYHDWIHGLLTHASLVCVRLLLHVPPGAHALVPMHQHQLVVRLILG